MIRAAAAAFVIATASSVTASPITQARSGETFHIAVRGALTLRLSERWGWTEPRVTGSAVDLTPVEYFRDPGFREWRVVGHVPGRATIRATGLRDCSGCGDGARRFAVTVVVSR